MMSKRPTVTMTTAGQPSKASLVPPLIVAIPTPESNMQDNLVMKSVADDVVNSHLGMSVKIFTGDEDAVIIGQLFMGDLPGGYNAFDVGENDLSGTSDRLADPSTMLARLYGGYSGLPHPVNKVGYNNSQFDKLYDQQLKELDLTKRKFLVDWMTNNYVRMIPQITLGFPTTITAYNKDRVTGVIPNGIESIGNIWTFLNGTSLVGSDTFTVAVIANGDGDVIPATYNIFAYAVRTEGIQGMLLTGVYDNLLKSKPDGSVVPSLASSWDEINSTNVVLHLRPGSKWSDGQAVTSQDVVFTFNYLAKYAQPVILKPYLTAVKNVIAVDDATVRFILTQPYAPFITNTLTQIPILPQHIWDGLLQQQGAKNPSDLKLTTDMMVGSGPWKLVTWNYGSQIVFERNPYYYIQPHYKTIRYVYFNSQTSSVTALEQGQIDTLAALQTLTGPQMKEVQTIPSLRIVEIPTWTYYFLLIQLRHLPFADIAFRQAFSRLINYQKIDDVAFEGHLVLGAGVIAPMNTAWSCPALTAQALKTIFNYNVTAAKQILTNAGYQWDSDGNLHYPESYVGKNVTAFAAQDYKYAVPINQVISTVPAPQGMTTVQSTSSTPIFIPMLAVEVYNNRKETPL